MGTRSHLETLRQPSTTVAASRAASWCASARPMPLLAPAITTIAPARLVPSGAAYTSSGLGSGSGSGLGLGLGLELA